MEMENGFNIKLRFTLFCVFFLCVLFSIRSSII